MIRLVIPPARVKLYLLNPDHPEGWLKARFFLARGFLRADPDILVKALAEQAARGWPGDEIATVDVIKHRIVGPIACPDGTNPDILTVWQVRDRDTAALFVTARPHRRGMKTGGGSSAIVKPGT